MDEHEIKKRRKELIDTATKKTLIKNKDKRVNSGRLCGICGTPLSKFNLLTQDSMAVKAHYHLYYNELFQVNICRDIKTCKKVHRELRKGESSG